MIRISVDLPQPEGPISAPIRPASRRKFRFEMTSTVWPEALLKSFRATRTSSGPGAPAGDSAFKGLHHESFDHEHRRREGQRIGEKKRDIEKLERHAGFEADPVGAAETFDHQHDLPHQRQPRWGRCRKV